jgi:cell division septation protein DedD
MRGVFGDQGFQPAEARRDTELTLSSTSLLLILFGLLLLCGVCFGLGYAMGHSGTQDTAALVQPAGAEPAAAQTEGRPKPSANSQPGGNGMQPDAAADADASAAASGASESAQGAVVSASSGPPSATSNAPSSASGQVKPALGSSLPNAAPVPAASAVGPALPPPGSVMVQIAAVSQQEDADVLMGALRKHGYAVAARRDPLDDLIHVRIGPFKTRDEAEIWREKLLSDGYNAIVQP